MRWSKVFIIFACLTSVTPASAHQETDAQNQASFQVEVTREVANDWASARLAVVAEGDQPAAVADEVNRKMAAAIAIAKKVHEVEVKSGAYTTQPVYKNSRIVRWRASQEMRLESEDVGRLSDLIGKLQEKSVLLSSMRFSVQGETQKALEDELIEEALAAFQARAKLIAKGLGAKSWSLMNLSVQSAGNQRPPVYARADAEMMSLSKAAAPAFEAGTSEVRVNVNGRIELD